MRSDGKCVWKQQAFARLRLQNTATRKDNPVTLKLSEGGAPRTPILRAARNPGRGVRGYMS